MKSIHFGSALIDIITLVASEDIEQASFSNEAKSFLMLEAGRKLPARSITTHVGGGACNTAVSLARCGWEASVLAKVGQDHNAGGIRKHLADNKVGDRLVNSDEHLTGTGVMIASHDRNASIFVHRGANEQLVVDDLPEFSGQDLVYIAPLSSGSADCFPEIAQRAKKAGAITAANPGIRQLTSRLEPFLDAMTALDLLSINRAEADALVPAVFREARALRVPAPSEDSPALFQRGVNAAGLGLNLIAFMTALRQIGPNWVSITDGTDGAYLAGPDGVLWHPSLPAEVAGTAGAGDAFCSTLTGALAEGLEPARAMRHASLNAAAVVSKVDTTSGLLTADVLQQRAADLDVEAQQLT